MLTKTSIEITSYTFLDKFIVPYVDHMKFRAPLQIKGIFSLI